MGFQPQDLAWLNGFEEYYREILVVVSAGSHKLPTCSPHPCRHHWSFLTSLCPSVFCCIWLLAVEWFLIGLWEVTVRDVFLCSSPFTLSREGRGRFLEHEIDTQCSCSLHLKRQNCYWRGVLIKNSNNCLYSFLQWSLKKQLKKVKQSCIIQWGLKNKLHLNKIKKKKQHGMMYVILLLSTSHWKWEFRTGSYVIFDLHVFELHNGE